MPIIMTHRYFLVFPDGLIQEVQFPLNVQPGDLLPSELLKISPEPSGKFIVRRVEEIDIGELPRQRKYFLEKF